MSENLSGVRLAVLERDRYRCAFCGEPAQTIDHVLSKAEGRRCGIKRWDKRWIVAACRDCNIRKGTRRLVPIGYTWLSDLRDLTRKKWAEWDGSREMLKEIGVLR